MEKRSIFVNSIFMTITSIFIPSMETINQVKYYNTNIILNTTPKIIG